MIAADGNDRARHACRFPGGHAHFGKPGEANASQSEPGLKASRRLDATVEPAHSANRLHRDAQSRSLARQMIGEPEARSFNPVGAGTEGPSRRKEKVDSRQHTVDSRNAQASGREEV